MVPAFLRHLRRTLRRAQAKKALAVLAKTEEAVRQTEAMERLKIEAEHNVRFNRLMAELERVREELDIRVRVIGAEMVRWRAQAEAAAAAVRDAKDEVCFPGAASRCRAAVVDAQLVCRQLMDRKRELDVTKERMDGLVEKLYVGARLAHTCTSSGSHSQHLRAGREKGLELRGAIDSHLERFGQQAHAASAAAASAELPTATAQPAPPSSTSAKSDLSPGPGLARTPPTAPQAPQAKPEAPARGGYADLSRANKAKTPS